MDHDLLDGLHNCSQELAMMQGSGEREWWYYKMNEVPDKLMRSFIGNAYLGSTSRPTVVRCNGVKNLERY